MIGQTARERGRSRAFSEHFAVRRPLGVSDGLVREVGDAALDGLGVEEAYGFLVAGLAEEALAGPEHPQNRYYSPGLLHGILLSSGRGLGDLGGLEPGVVVVPSGASLVAAPPS